MTVLSARASELELNFPFGVVRQLFEPLLAGADRPTRTKLLDGAASLAAPLLGRGAQDADAAITDSHSPLAHFHALYWLAANLADLGPAALTIDDVHWADAGSLRFLQFLLPRLDELPVLVVLAGRPEGPEVDRNPLDVLATDALSLTLRPAPLSSESISSLIEAELGQSADPEFSRACHAATGGNPFLVRELLRELSADRLPPTSEQVAHVRQLAPRTVARAVLLRLARLSEDVLALARAVAVLGDGTPLRRACALAGLSDERGSECAAALARVDILTAERPLAFAHPVLRSAVYGDIDPAERSRGHRLAAARLGEEGAAADAIALHLLATEPAADPYVVETLRDAAAHALARGAASTAVACLRRALSEPPPAAERGEVVFDLASAELRAGEPAAAVDHFGEAMRVVSDPRVHGARVWEHAVALQAIGRGDEAFAVRERAAAEVASVDPELARSIEASLVATARLDLSRLEWARAHTEPSRGRLSPEAPSEWRLLAMRAHLDAFSIENDEPAEGLADAAERALASAQLVDEQAGVSTPFFAAIEVLLLADRAGPARRALNETVERAQRRGPAPSVAVALGWRCQLLAREGELAEAEADARTCAELSLPQGWFRVAPPVVGYIVEVLIDRGEFDDADRLLEGSGLEARTVDQDLTFDPAIHARARLSAARGDLERARADLAALARRRARWNTYPTLVPPALIAPPLAPSDPDEARELAERTLREARSWGTPRAIGTALHAAGLLEGSVDTLDVLEEAVRVLERSPARLEHARALADFGAALRRSGGRAASRDPLRRALDIAEACDARPLGNRTRHELRAAGGRPRRARISGADALTASERRITAMAANGLSNPEIAQTLFVTKKTVESHLGSAYRKLGIRSRTQLGAALRDQQGR